MAPWFSSRIVETITTKTHQNNNNNNDDDDADYQHLSKYQMHGVYMLPGHKNWIVLVEFSLPACPPSPLSFVAQDVTFTTLC